MPIPTAQSSPILLVPCLRAAKDSAAQVEPSLEKRCAPAPQGPGLGLAEPSVKQTMEVGGGLAISRAA